MTAPASIPALIAEGRRLIAEATPGPLEVDAIDPYDVITRHYEPVAEHESPAGATLHVFAVNNLAALLDVAEAADKVHDAMEAYQGASGYHSYRALLDAHAALDSAISRLRGVR